MNRIAMQTMMDLQEVWRHLVQFEYLSVPYKNMVPDMQNIMVMGSKSFEKVRDIYPGRVVVKYECYGHCQKRVGNRLRNLRKKTKGPGGKNKTNVADVVSAKNNPKKVLKAKSIFTNRLIDKLHNYFGIALRSNVGNVRDM